MRLQGSNVHAAKELGSALVDLLSARSRQQGFADTLSPVDERLDRGPGCRIELEVNDPRLESQALHLVEVQSQHAGAARPEKDESSRSFFDVGRDRDFVSTRRAKRKLGQVEAGRRPYERRNGGSAEPGTDFEEDYVVGTPDEISIERARADVGRPGVTLVTLDAAGERLGPAMAEFHQHLRSLRQQKS